MFILGDENQHHGKLPWVTGSLVVLNLLAFCAQQFLGESLTFGFSLVPLEITELRDLTRPEQVKVKVPTHLFYDHQAKQVRTAYGHDTVTVPHYHGPFPIILTLLTSMFLHGDWLHLIGNLWFLAVFGRNVECAFDHGRFLAFYLACGVAGGLAHVFSDTSSVIPLIGASGAISGIMGAYVAIYPLNKIKIWLGWWLGVIELPALVVVGFWFLVQYLSAFIELETGLHDGVAYWDHLGGFGAGLAIVWGTVFYLKHQQANAPPMEEESPAADPLESALPAAEKKTPDPLAAFLPTAITAKPPTGVRQKSISDPW
jgi:hypothetical protein